MNPLVELQKLGQSIWYDNLRRALIETGDLARKIGTKGITSTLGQKVAGDGLRGVTSNPTIFEKAIIGSTDYDRAIRELIGLGKDAQQIYEALIVEDIQRAADLFAQVYSSTDGLDGYVSVEVSPLLAHDAQSSIAEAERLWRAIDRENVMIKIPATPAGLPAIEELIAWGININVTLIFSMRTYEQVAEAYIRGLERRLAAGLPVDRVASVASVFISRIDTAVDNELEFRIRRSEDDAEKAQLSELLGKAAIANAKLIYQRFKEIFYGERFARLRSQGARPQRPLWASTGTKNPTYSDVYYVEELIGPDTVNTLPPATFTAFRDHGRVRLSLEEDLDQARQTIERLSQIGIDLMDVAERLQEEGVKAFVASFRNLIGSIEAKREALEKGQLRQKASLGRYEPEVERAIERAKKEDWMRRIWNKDASLWKNDPDHQKIIKDALGWVTIVEKMIEQADELEAFSRRVIEDGFTHVLLLGMGGSSLCPEVFRRTFGRRQGFPTLHVLDSTDPATIASFEQSIDLQRTLFIVASKSGTTTEPMMFHKYFLHRARQIKGDTAGKSFIAITDPNTLLEAMAKGDGFRRIFLNPADIGGRYSALSFFGMVPAALQGFDFRQLLDRAERMQQASAHCVPAEDNPAIRLGAALGALALSGRDKLTLLTSPEIASLGLWIEQLIAESTGKEGKGIIPIAGEPLGPPSAYGDDRIFVYVGLGDPDPETEKKLSALGGAGHPVIRHTLSDLLDLGAEFYLWEMATAIAGAFLGINPFDQPNVQESKDNTRRLLEEYKMTGALPEEEIVAEGRGLKIFASQATRNHIGSVSSVEDLIKALLAGARPGDYIAMLNYIQETEEHEEIISAIRTHLRDALRVATTAGYGPRFLHSTGQLHKGGPPSGIFIQVTAEDRQDIPIPGEPFSFGVLKRAQALGDFLSLSARGRRAIWLKLGQDVASGLRTLLEIVREAFPIGRGQTS
jgi:transaldolase/glucose-6-phosphate isomerase